jgi:coatomer protein complex subunit gamma
MIVVHLIRQKDTAMGSDVIYRSNAIRALTRIIDASTVQAIERLIKTAIVDKTPSVSSAALVSSYHLLPIGTCILSNFDHILLTINVARDVVRRWGNEVQSAVEAKSGGGFLSFSTSAAVPQQTSYNTQ